MTAKHPNAVGIPADGHVCILNDGRHLVRPAAVPGRPGVPVVVIRLDATVIFAADRKDGAEPNYKGCGFHPVRREALSIRAEVRDHRRRTCRSRAV